MADNRWKITKEKQMISFPIILEENMIKIGN